MMKKENLNLFSLVSFFAFLVTLILSFMDSKFIPSCMLMLSLLIFSICYVIKDTNKKIILYVLYVVGIVLIIGSLVYTNMRIR